MQNGETNKEDQIYNMHGRIFHMCPRKLYTNIAKMRPNFGLPDLSDEDNCELVAIDERYRKKIAPFTYINNTKKYDLCMNNV